MFAGDDEFPVLNTVLLDLVLEQRAEFPAPVRQDLTLHDFHQAAVFVFKLFAERHDRVRLRDKAHQCFIAHVHGAFAQGNHAAVGGITAHGVDGGHHGYPCPGGFLRGVGLRATHLTDHDHIGVETQCHVKQSNLIYPLALVFGIPGQGMDHGIPNPTFLIPAHQRQLPGAVFDTVDTLAVGNGG